jgi:hypothetical protein
MRGTDKTMPSLRRILVAPAAALSLVLALSGVTLAATVTNGDFETGTLAGWTVVNSGSGGWFNYTGTSSPLSHFTIPAPPQGSHAAISDQFGPGSHLLYQDIALEPGYIHTLSFTYYLNNRASAFFSPATLSPFSGPNQQYRIDVLNPAAPADSVAPADVLLPIFATKPGDPLALAPTATTADLTPFAGTTVRLRFAEVDNELFFQAGVDAVTLYLSPATTEQCKKDGWQSLTDTAGNAFKNQGDCVSWVATDHRNPAG